MNNTYDVAIVGAGFTGLTAAFCLSKKGYKVIVLESESHPGGLAGTFEFSDNVTLEKFYHHWFNNDEFVPELVKELGMEGDIVLLPTNTGMYFNGRIWKLSSPLDLLKFKALSFIGRIRLGLLVFQVRRIKDWRQIEHLSIEEWLVSLCGQTVYDIVWKPLVESKFSVYSNVVNAVWMWKKLVLRGSTRNNRGGEELAYFKGGFGRLAEMLVSRIESNGGKVTYGNKVLQVDSSEGHISSLETSDGNITANHFLFTPAPSVVADFFHTSSENEWIESLRRVKYLGNICLVLRLNKSLSDTYWLNVNDPGFPFVGVIEHTNFDSPKNYDNSHIVYLSKYIAVEDPVWKFEDADYYEFCLKFILQMFPEFDESWVLEYKVWRSRYAQPVMEINYSQIIPKRETPFRNGWLSNMSQIYPEDRGTNYAIREGRAIAETILQELPEDEPCS